jgi:branched-subunit amino acid ABC-type transport system permease component
LDHAMGVAARARALLRRLLRCLRGLRIVCLALLIAPIVAGCARVDAEQARLCRIAIGGLEAGDARIEIVSQTPLATRAGSGAQILYQVSRAGDFPVTRSAVCLFAGSASSVVLPRNLIGIVFNGRRLGDVRRYLLIRHWLENPTSAVADPEPIEGAGRATRVPASVAVALQTMIASLPLISIYALLAAAYSLIYGLIGRINLAFGELAIGGAMAAYLGAAAAGQGEFPWIMIPLAVVLAALTGTMYSALSGAAVLAPLSRRPGQMVLVATVGLSLALQEYFRLAQGAGVHWMKPVLDAPFAVARAGDYVVTLTPVALLTAFVALAAAVCVLAAMKHTRFGRRWRACADDPIAASMLGIDPRRVLILTAAEAGALAGLAGCLTTLFYGGAGHSGGLTIGLKALIAAILGGIGSVPGAFVGGLIIGSAEAAWSAFLPIEHRDLFIYLLLAVVLALRPAEKTSLDNRERATRP